MRRFLAILCLLSLPALGAQPAKLACYSDTFPPYVMQDGDKVVGVDVDAVREAAASIGVQLEIRLLPWKRLEAELSKGAASTVQCAFSFSRTPERDAYLLFGQEPLHVTAYTLFVHAEHQARLAAFPRGGSAIVGVRRGFKLPATLESARQEGRAFIEEVDVEQSNFLKLARLRLDFALSNLDVGRYTIRQLKLTHIVPQSEPLSMLPTYLVFSRGHGLAQLMPQLDQALAKLRQSGRYQAIYDHYM